MSILTLQDAKDQLVITDNDHDRQVQRSLDNAEAYVRSWLKSGWDPTWAPDDLPGEVYQAIVFALTLFYEVKGDNIGDKAEKLDGAVTRLLARRRVGAVA